MPRMVAEVKQERFTRAAHGGYQRSGDLAKPIVSLIALPLVRNGRIARPGQSLTGKARDPGDLL